MSRLFSCPEACRQAEPPPDIRKAAHIRSHIRRDSQPRTFAAKFAGIFRPVRIRKDSQPRTFAKPPVFAGLRPHLRMFRHFRRILPTFLSRDDHEHVCLNIRSQIKEKPRQSFAGDRGECLRPGYILCKHHKWCP